MTKLGVKSLWSLLITIVFCLFILPINERLAFTVPTDHKNLLISYGLKFLFAIFLFFILIFAFTFAEKVRDKDKDYIRWLKYSSIYLAIMLVFFVLIYPGHWVWDEFNILSSVKVYDPYAWQGFLTNVWYTFCLYLIPSGVSIVLFQIIFCSLVVGYVVTQSQKLLRNKRLAYWLFALFLLPPIILNNFYPLRLTMYAYIELLLISRLIFLYFKQFKTDNKYRELLIFALLIMLVAFWRSEGIYYLLLFPVVIYLLKIFNRNNLTQAASYVYTAFALFIIIAGYKLAQFSHDPQYDLTAYISPLSIMLQKPLHGTDINQRLKDVNQVISVSDLKNNPSYDEVPAYWIGVQKGYLPHVKEFRKQYIYLVIHNPGSFLDARFKTFMSTNSFGDRLPFINKSQLTPFKLSDDDSHTAAVVTAFENNNRLAKPIDLKVKQDVTAALLFHGDNRRFDILGHIFWDVIPAIVLLLLLGLKKLFSRQYFWALLSFFVLLSAPLLFLAAPANYFMYYLPVYIVGYFIVTLNILLYFDKYDARQLAKRLTFLR